MPQLGFEPMNSVFERAKTFYALDRVATVNGTKCYYCHKIKEDEMGRACSTHGRDEKFVDNFHLKNLYEE
jgi:recombinational DNA repair protein RecR